MFNFLRKKPIKKEISITHTHAAKRVIAKCERLLKHEGKQLPKSGLLTGQAVASMFLECLGFDRFKTRKELIVNDLDIFRVTNENFEGSNNFMVKNSKPELYRTGDYGRFISQQVTEKYRVVATNTYGMLNVTHVKFYESDRNCNTCPENENFMDILNKFDINSTQFGINIATGEPIVTNGFKKFMKTGELEITDLGTPTHTAIRFVKKMEEGGFYGNIDIELAKCAITIKILGISLPYLFSTKYHNLYCKYENILSGYFNANSFTFYENIGEGERPENFVQKYKLYTLELVENKLVEKAFEFFNDVKFADNTISILKSMNIYFYQGDAYKTKLKNVTKELKVIVAKSSQQNSHNLLSLLENFSLSDKQMLSSPYKRLLNSCNNHVDMFFFYYSLNSLQKAIEWDNYLRKLAKEEGEHIWGVAENVTFNLENPTFEDFEEFKVKYIEDNTGELTEKSIKTFEDDTWHIEELVCKMKLMTEGSFMSHCVGGYGGKIERGVCKIVAIRHKSDKAMNYTVEISEFVTDYNKETPYENKVWHIAQCVTYANGQTTTEVRQNVMDLLTPLTNLKFVSEHEKAEINKKYYEDIAIPVVDVDIDEEDLPF